MFWEPKTSRTRPFSLMLVEAVSVCRHHASTVLPPMLQHQQALIQLHISWALVIKQATSQPAINCASAVDGKVAWKPASWDKGADTYTQSCMPRTCKRATCAAVTVALLELASCLKMPMIPHFLTCKESRRLHNVARLDIRSTPFLPQAYIWTKDRAQVVHSSQESLPSAKSLL